MFFQIQSCAKMLAVTLEHNDPCLRRRRLEQPSDFLDGGFVDRVATLRARQSYNCDGSGHLDLK
jgi:hypothetical protein